MRKPEGPPCASCGGMDHARRSSRKCPYYNRAYYSPTTAAAEEALSSSHAALLSSPHRHNNQESISHTISNTAVQDLAPNNVTVTIADEEHVNEREVNEEVNGGKEDRDKEINNTSPDVNIHKSQPEKVGHQQLDISTSTSFSSISPVIPTDFTSNLNSIRKPRAKNGQGTRTIRREEELQNAKLITCPIKRTRAFGDGFRTIIHKIKMLEKTTDCMVCLSAGSIDSAPVNLETAQGSVANYTSPKLEQPREKGYFVDLDGNPIDVPGDHSIKLIESAKVDIDIAIGLYQFIHRSKASLRENDKNIDNNDDDIIYEDNEDSRASSNFQSQNSLLQAREETVRRAEQDRLTAEQSLKRDREEFERERSDFMHQFELERAKLVQERKFFLDSTKSTSPVENVNNNNETSENRSFTST